MSALNELKENLEKAIQEHASLESQNKKLDSAIIDKRLTVNQLNDSIKELESQKANLDNEVKKNREAKLAAIDKRDAESEKMAIFVAEEKKELNRAKGFLLDERLTLDKEKKAMNDQISNFNEKVEILAKAIKQVQ